MTVTPSNTTSPSNLKSEALSILVEIPHAYIALSNSTTTKSTVQKRHFLDGIRDVHRQIATAFGEPRPVNIGVTSISDDLIRWSNVWTWHPHANHWVAQLRHHLHIANGASEPESVAPDESEFRWVAKRDAVCPRCLTMGHLSYQESSWDHHCPRTGTTWMWKDYRDAIREALAQYRESAA